MPMPEPEIARALALALCALTLAGCGVPRIPGITPYRIEIQQGNYISPDMVAQLKTGMSKEQVRFVLGTPLLNDIFHADRWDYIYTREQADGTKESRKLVVFFEDNKLVRMAGDMLPAAGAVPPVDAGEAR